MGRPSLVRTAARVAAAREAAQVSRLVSREYRSAAAGLEALIERLTKTARTLNPQDKSRAAIEASVESLQALLAAVGAELKSLEHVSV